VALRCKIKKTFGPRATSVDNPAGAPLFDPGALPLDNKQPAETRQENGADLNAFLSWGWTLRQPTDPDGRIDQKRIVQVRTIDSRNLLVPKDCRPRRGLRGNRTR
jgi:hypothetical protein